jgi:hypothetical protein
MKNQFTFLLFLLLFQISSLTKAEGRWMYSNPSDSVAFIKIKKSGGRKNTDGTVTFSTVKQTSSSKQWVLECSGKGDEKCQFYIAGIADGPNTEGYDIQKGTAVAEELYYYFLKNCNAQKKEYKLTVSDPISQKVYTAILTTTAPPNPSNPTITPIQILVFTSP